MKKQAPSLSSFMEGKGFAWLDTLADPVQAKASDIFHSGTLGRTIKNWLNGTPLRHRVHPALIIWPLGAWMMGSVFDLLDSLDTDHGRGYQRGADLCLGFGIIGALPTAAAGVADWVDTGDHQRRVGMAHALLNSAALLLYSASLGLRLANSEQRGAARTLAGLGLGAVMASGALGGELVYTLGLNVPYLLYPKAPNKFVDVLASSELPEDKPVVVEVERVPVLLRRQNGQIHAVQAWCPHVGGPLAEGTFEGDIVECPWHQSRFHLSDGRPIQGPAAVSLRTFEVREENGRIAVRPSYEGQDWPPPPAPPQSKPVVVEH